ncbi:hypothetical protein ACOMHN_032823 [Nucella lapillus]
MYNGIGLMTARGSGTNGFVQRNLSTVKHTKDRINYKSEEDVARLEKQLNRQPNAEILNHDRKRRVELKCMEMEELMEEQGRSAPLPMRSHISPCSVDRRVDSVPPRRLPHSFLGHQLVSGPYSEDEIHQKVSMFRKMLMEKEGSTDSPLDMDEFGRPIAKETHQLAEANQEKNQRLREAFGLGDYVDGSAFDPNRKAKEEAAKATAMATKKYGSVFVCLLFFQTGESGLGKSTLINSLFLTELYKDRDIPSVLDTVNRTVAIEKKQLEIEEKGVRVKLTIVDTPGYNDAVNAQNSHSAIVDYVDEQFQQYYRDECGLNRRNIVDNRVHCCLYFISPYGHGLKPADVEVMKKLHHKVNIVPLLAKSDMLTKVEQKRLKQRIIEEIDNHDIHIYEFPDCDSDEDEDFKQQDRELKAAVPFAVVGCNMVVELAGKKIRGRAYPWGIVEVDNPSHCDCVRLRQMLISTHMQDLKDVTADVHYENFRASYIQESMAGQQRERSKLKRDSKPSYDDIAETDKLLEQKDAEIQRMQQMLAKMQEQLGKQTQVNGKV